ncbi:MAG: arginase family protein [gamma proteobacterium symbiont of Bathyaustriella thionipta]|nr:arginase family protein [gamma proteobacterium symbiont of Bathyaustriella thionipta]MCU7951629.1 arginase family protein [gamma proteobacterium symbiont of Bathyaustriella thionipta]MCU7958216.1 arginase family protein [gamma proteobacterium symbiont of Bathyaustriella thionipta]
MDSNRAVTLINTFGVAACLGGSQDTCHNAPYVIRTSQFQHYLTEKNLILKWRKIVIPMNSTANSLHCLSKINHEIASLTYRYTIKNVSQNTVNHPFLLISGDHSSAIGTWSGVMQAKSLGLIWIDAHLDAHTLETSPSGNLHGMPLSVLLQKADQKLQSTYPQLNLNKHFNCHYLSGKNLALLGTRSYEAEEYALLKKVNASIYDMQTLNQNPIPTQQLNMIAKDLLTRCDVIGISLDLDAISPEDAPAVETPENNGVSGEMLISMLESFSYKKNLIGFEISEFNPVNDIKQKTEKLIMQLIGAIFNQ